LSVNRGGEAHQKGRSTNKGKKGWGSGWKGTGWRRRRRKKVTIIQSEGKRKVKEGN